MLHAATVVGAEWSLLVIAVHAWSPAPPALLLLLPSSLYVAWLFRVSAGRLFLSRAPQGLGVRVRLPAAFELYCSGFDPSLCLRSFFHGRRDSLSFSRMDKYS